MLIRSIIIPAIIFTNFEFFVKNPMICLLNFWVATDNMSKGSAIPIAKNRKLSMFPKKPVVDIALVKNTANIPGLHGIIIAPKNKP